jgi:hypothetical protein
MRLAIAEAEKARIEARLRQTPAADRRVVERISALVDRVREIVASFEDRVYATGGATVARACADLERLLGTAPVAAELGGAQARAVRHAARLPSPAATRSERQNRTKGKLW